MIDQGNLTIPAPKKRQIPKISSRDSDAAEFANKVKDQVRKKTEKNVERGRTQEKNIQ